MDHLTAKSIAAAYKPALQIDEQNAKIPNALIVRRTKDGDPFCIHIPSSVLVDAESPVRDEQALKDALDAADKMLPA